MKEQTNGERFDEFMKTVEYPELEGTMNLCEDVIKGKGELRYKDGTPIRSYDSPKIQAMVDLIKEDDTSSQTEISDEEIEQVKRFKDRHVKEQNHMIATLYKEIERLLEQKLK